MKNMNFSDIWLFLSVARLGGLTAAANARNSSAATIGRRMLALEVATGRRLFQRRQTGYELTADGRAMLEIVSPLEDIAASLSRWSEEKGTHRRVTISAGHWVTRLLTQNYGELCGSEDKFSLEFVAASKLLSIAHREADLGVRNRRPSEAGLAGQKLSNVEFAVYSSKENLTSSRWVVSNNAVPSSDWVRKNHGARIVAEVSDPRNLLDLAKSGAGVCVLPVFTGDAEPLLVRTGEVIPELTHAQYLVMHHDDRFDPTVREVIKRVTSLLKSKVTTTVKHSD